MVKLRFLSDTHFNAGLNGLENNSTKSALHTPFGAYFAKELKKETNCINILAGDVASSLVNHSLFLNTFFENQYVFFIDGNHLVYQDTNKTIYELKAELYQNFPKDHLFWHYLENDWMWIPGTNDTVAIIGSTFYTDYEYETFTLDSYNEYRKHWNDVINAWGYGDNKEYIPVKKLTKTMIKTENLMIASEYLNDFSWGKETSYKNISPETYLKLNKLAKAEVIRCHNEIVKINPNAKIILVTHHCLSPQCIDEKYVKNHANASYVSNLEKWINKNLPNVKLVNSGHVHCRKDFKFGKNKRYIVNACGYIRRHEPFNKPKFKPNFIIDTDDL